MSEPPAGGDERIWLLYDGLCGLCDRTVRFVLKRDRRDRFRFAPLQSPVAAEALRRHGRDPDALDTFYLVLDPGGPRERLVGKGRAAIAIAREAGGIYRALGLFGWLPTPLLDFVYGVVARRRYRLFGKFDACPLPDPAQRAKFLWPGG